MVYSAYSVKSLYSFSMFKVHTEVVYSFYSIVYSVYSAYSVVRSVYSVVETLYTVNTMLTVLCTHYSTI